MCSRPQRQWRPKKGGKATQAKYVLNRLDSACKKHMKTAQEEQAPVPTQGLGAQLCRTPITLDSDRGVNPRLLPAVTEHEESFSFSTQEQPVCAEGAVNVNKWLSRSRRKTTPRKTAMAFAKSESPVGLSGPKFFSASLLDDSDTTQTHVQIQWELDRLLGTLVGKPGRSLSMLTHETASKPSCGKSWSFNLMDSKPSAPKPKRRSLT